MDPKEEMQCTSFYLAFFHVLQAVASQIFYGYSMSIQWMQHFILIQYNPYMEQIYKLIHLGTYLYYLEIE